MSFWEHIEELIRRLKVVLYALVISTVAMMVLPANIFYLNQPGLYEPLIANFEGDKRSGSSPRRKISRHGACGSY
jgi:hypothetical protein